MIEQCTKEVQRLKVRGLQNSSMAVTAKHKVLETKLKESVGIIIKTVMDIIRKNDLLIDQEEIQELCSEALSKRRDEIEGHYASEKDLIKLGLQNTAMLKGFLSLNESYPLQREEMIVALALEYKKYIQNNQSSTSDIGNGFDTSGKKRGGLNNELVKKSDENHLVLQHGTAAQQLYHCMATLLRGQKRNITNATDQERRDAAVGVFEDDPKRFSPLSREQVDLPGPYEAAEKQIRKTVGTIIMLANIPGADGNYQALYNSFKKIEKLNSPQIVSS